MSVAARVRGRPLTAFFGLAFAVSWAIWIGGLLRLGPDASLAAASPYVLAGSFGPTVAAVVMLAAAPRRGDAWRDWARGFLRLKAHPAVYGAALFGLPLAFGSLLVILGIEPLPDNPPALVWVTLIPMAPLNALVGSVILGAGPLGEEPGWRGYALDRLLESRGDWGASAVLGVLWALWHLPIMLGVPEWRAGVSTAIFLPSYTAGVVALALAFTKLWRWSRGSLPVAIWFHGVVNFTANYAVDRGIWDLAGYSDLDLHLLSGAGVLLLAGAFDLADRWRRSSAAA